MVSVWTQLADHPRHIHEFWCFDVSQFPHPNKHLILKYRSHTTFYSYQYHIVITRWFKVSFSSPSWRSLNHPKKGTKNCQVHVPFLGFAHFFVLDPLCLSLGGGSHAIRVDSPQPSNRRPSSSPYWLCGYDAKAPADFRCWNEIPPVWPQGVKLGDYHGKP